MKNLIHIIFITLLSCNSINAQDTLAKPKNPEIVLGISVEPLTIGYIFEWKIKDSKYIGFDGGIGRGFATNLKNFPYLAYFDSFIDYKLYYKNTFKSFGNKKANYQIGVFGSLLSPLDMNYIYYGAYFSSYYKVYKYLKVGMRFQTGFIHNYPDTPYLPIIRIYPLSIIISTQR
jgi:hypothetical protein